MEGGTVDCLKRDLQDSRMDRIRRRADWMSVNPWDTLYSVLSKKQKEHPMDLTIVAVYTIVTTYSDTLQLAVCEI